MQVSAAIKTLFAAALIWASAAVSAAALELMMVEERGCVWCARWNTEIAPIYPKTPEGAAAPLRRIDIRADLPDGITIARPLVFTPTFVLLRDGQEVARLEGYPGEHFFWSLLARMIEETKANEEGS